MSTSETPELRERQIAFERDGKAGRRKTGDVSVTAARRAGKAGLTFSICYLIFEVIYNLARLDMPWELRQHFLLKSGIGIALGLAMYQASKKWANNPELVLKLGLGFLVLSSLEIGMAETMEPFGVNEHVHGQSAIAAWLAAYTLLAPSPFHWAMPASIAAALMAPLGLWLNVLTRGNPMPKLEVWVLWSSGPMLMAVVCTLLARWVYELGQQLEAARDMGSYQLIEPVGQGGMGEVWRARHRFLARDAAVKLIGKRFASTPLQKKRFEREARVIARLECPHTVSIFDFGSTPSGELYFAMELIRGLNLDQLVQRFGPQTPGRVLHIWTGVLRSLEEAHREGLTHRDIKPSNILLARLGVEHDFVKVVDFGLVKARGVEEMTQLTMDQTTVGTPAYMAPELAEGDESKVDGRADIYAMGCVAYFLLTGKPVFEAPTPMALILKHLKEPVVPPSERSELPVPPDLEALILWCLKKDPTERPQDARALLDKMRAVDVDVWCGEQRLRWWKTHLPSMA